MNLWDAAYLTASPLFLGSAMVKRLRHGKYRQSLPGMFGRGLPEAPLAPHRERVWLHSVSVGEAVAAGGIFRLLRERHPDWEFLSTATTETGFEQAGRSLDGAQHRSFTPVDLTWVVRRFLDVYKPSVYLVFETEIWPNTLALCRERGIPAFLVNGKASEKSTRTYGRLLPLFRPALQSFRAMLMQTEEAAGRMRPLVGDAVPLHVTGNVKFDSLPAPLSTEERDALRAGWGVPEGGLAVLAGSTHRTEEKLVYTSLRNAAERLKAAGRPEPVLVVAPRHPERFDEAEKALSEAGARVHRLSTGGPVPAGSVCLLDRMGVLGRSFGASDIAIVGGAWNPIGGHNLLEPANHGVPVVHGPHMHTQPEIMRIMRASDASLEVTAEKLPALLFRLLEDEEERRLYGQRGREAAQRNAGAAHRTVELIEKCLEGRPDTSLTANDTRG